MIDHHRQLFLSPKRRARKVIIEHVQTIAMIAVFSTIIAHMVLA